jgi:hypothetical protein
MTCAENSRGQGSLGDGVFCKVLTRRWPLALSPPLVEQSAALVTAHRRMLTLRCPHFKAMLQSGMREASEPVVALEDVTAPLLHALLNFIYTVSQ